MVRYLIPRSGDMPRGLKPEPPVKQKKQKKKPTPTQQAEIKKQGNCRWCRFRRTVFPWLEPRGRICVPPTTHRPDILHGRSIDRREWGVVQQHTFPGPLNRYYAPDDPDKPDAYMFTVPGESRGLAPIPQYQDRYHDSHNPPPYEWARLSSLPVPVVVDDSWSSLLAAQREMSRLLETQSYLSSRIAEIDRKVKAVMDTKQETDPDLHRRFVGAQVAGAVHAAGLPDNRRRIIRDIEAGRVVDRAELEWMCDLEKLFVLRERLSPLSLLSPPPAH